MAKGKREKKRKAAGAAERTGLQGISGKLLVAVLPVLTATIIFIILFMAINARSIIVDLAKGQLAKETSSNANALGVSVEAVKSNFASTVDSLARLHFDSDDDLKKYLEATCGISDASPDGVYIGLSDDTYLDGSGWVPDADYRPTQRDWYPVGENAGEFTPGEPYVDLESGDIVVTFSRKVTLQDGRSGVAAFDYTISGMVEEVGKFKPLESGRSMMLGGEYVLAYENDSFNGSKISEHAADGFLQSIAAEISGTADVHRIKGDDGQQYYVAYAAVPGTDWTLISLVTEKTVLRTLNRFQTISIILMFVIVVVLGALMYVMIRRMVSKPVSGLTENIVRIADGDFTVEIADSNANDEIGSMNEKMKLFVGKMRSTLTELKEVTDRLGTEASNSTEASRVLHGEAEEQSHSMEQIKDAINGMSQAVTELAENATELAGAVSELTEEGQQTTEVMRNLSDKSKSGQKDMQEVHTEMNGIVSSMSEMNSMVSEVGESAKRINDIISMINNIASQTNLLSLNASIEAARAGEAGKGFAVVATEIGELASDSADATRQIEEIIHEVVSQIQQLSAKSAENMNEISASAESVKVADDTFHEIVSELTAAEGNMTHMIGKMAEVDNIASSMAAISEEQSASTQEISDTADNLFISANNVASKSKDVSQSAETVSDSSETIDDVVSMFRI